jgi:hypothetical protein
VEDEVANLYALVSGAGVGFSFRKPDDTAVCAARDSAITKGRDNILFRVRRPT